MFGRHRELSCHSLIFFILMIFIDFIGTQSQSNFLWGHALISTARRVFKAPRLRRSWRRRSSRCKNRCMGSKSSEAKSILKPMPNRSCMTVKEVPTLYLYRLTIFTVVRPGRTLSPPDFQASTLQKPRAEKGFSDFLAGASSLSDWRSNSLITDGCVQLKH